MWLHFHAGIFISFETTSTSPRSAYFGFECASILCTQPQHWDEQINRAFWIDWWFRPLLFSIVYKVLQSLLFISIPLSFYAFYHLRLLPSDVGWIHICRGSGWKDNVHLWNGIRTPRPLTGKPSTMIRYGEYSHVNLNVLSWHLRWVFLFWVAEIYMYLGPYSTYMHYLSQ